MPESFDYVIVGAGSAGCALAARLSEDPSAARRWCWRPAARDRSPNIKIPAAFAKQFRTKLDWDYTTGPETGARRARAVRAARQGRSAAPAR